MVDFAKANSERRERESAARRIADEVLIRFRAGEDMTQLLMNAAIAGMKHAEKQNAITSR